MRSFLLWGFCLSMIAFGVNELLPTGFALEQMHRLRYPNYLLTILACSKFAGVAVLLGVGRGRLREWALAGFAIDLAGAFASHVLVGDYLLSLGSVFYGAWLAALIAINETARLPEGT